MPGWINGIGWMNNISFAATKPLVGDLDADGKIIIGRTGLNPVGATLSSSDGTVTITNGSGSIDLSVLTVSAIWENIGASQALVNNHGYICGSGAAISLSLPSSAAVGSIIEVVLDGATSWTITQGAGQRIRIGSQQTTAGIGGNIASTGQGDAIRLVCRVSGTNWTCVSLTGNLTIT